MNTYTAIKYLRGAIQEMTMHEFVKLPPKQRIEFCKAALKATENVEMEDKNLPALLRKQAG